MSFGAGSIFEVNGGTGSDTANGGGFDTSATFATDLTATSANTASPVVSSATYNFATIDNSQYLFIGAGTNWVPGWYPVVSTASNSATLNAAVGAVVLFNGPTPFNTVVGCATVTSPTVGTWGMDYSRSGSPAVSFTDMVIGATTTQFTSVANPVGPNMVGNFISVTSGSGFTVQRVEVTAFTAAGLIATCDKSLGTTLSTGGHGGLGGALASPGKAAGTISGSSASGMMIFIMGSNTYNMSNNSNASGGYVGGIGGGVTIVGYTVNRVPYNLDANRPILQSTGGNSYTLIAMNGGSSSIHCLDFENGNSNTGIVCFDDGGNFNSYTWNCKFNGVSKAVAFSNTSTVKYCWINACTGNPCMTGNATNGMVEDCVFTANTTCVFSATVVTRCIFYNNGSSASGMINNARHVESCLFHTTTANSSVCVKGCYSHTNLIFWNNAATSAVAISPTVTDNTVEIVNCAFGSNTKDVTTGSTFPGFKIPSKIVLSVDPCNSASTGDFSLNNTAGGGLLLRNLGFPTEFANSLTANYLDVGPAQHPCPVSSNTAASACVSQP